MKIAVDAMGGDFAPRSAVEGAWRVAREDATEILLVGDRAAIEGELARLGGSVPTIEIVHAEETVGMDEAAITPVRRKRRSSIRICTELVRDQAAQALVTAGNTGAAMIAAKLIIGTIPGVDRPALAAVFPTRTGRTVVLDVGANVGSKPAQLRQFAVMGHAYAQRLLGTAAPRVGLMSIGEEDTKGTDITRAVFDQMKDSGLNFVGNVEGRDVFRGTVDVIVCDGFVGNVILKSAESLASLMSSMLREEMNRSWRTRLGYLLARPAFDNLSRRTDYREHGAVPLLGVQGGCFIGHGRSSPRAVESAIRRAVEFVRAELHTHIEQEVAVLHEQENRLLKQGMVEEVS
jgi:glycerol-3-phosphate acyltransferase PlsX